MYKKTSYIRKNCFKKPINDAIGKAYYAAYIA